MSISSLRIAVLLALAPAAIPAAAQEGGVEPTLASCAAIEAAAARLACYDRLAQRTAESPQEADLAAAKAREALQAPTTAEAEPDRDARARTDDLFVQDEALGRALANAGRGSLLDSRWELARDSKLGIFNFRVYKPVYLMPAFWTSRVNDMPTSENPRNTVTEPMQLDALETKYQLSFKTKAAKGLIANHGDLWLGYTQTSHWQVYNSGLSRPFRETSYEPEVMAVFRTDYSLFGWSGRMAAVHLNHQSNGRTEPFSRSWNRVIAQFGFERDDWMLTIRPWWRIPESAATDDNPDIQDYMGRADLLLVRKSEGHETTLMLRHSLRTGSRSHGAVEIGHAFPIASYLKGYIQVFSGYGASMLDYNHRQTRIGIGISLVQWL